MTLDLHTPKGQDIVRRLVPRCDVVLENFRPGVLERWGLGWQALHAINPRLVMARITAFGQTGPLNQGPGYAAIGSAFGGTWYVNGHADRPPARPTLAGDGARLLVLNGVTMDIESERTDGRTEAIRVDVTGAGLP